MTSTTWYRENSVWPYVHSATPAAVYIWTRDPVLALLIAYISETAEVILSSDIPTLNEQMWDSLVADPITDGLAILVFWLLDQLMHTDVIVLIYVPWWRRLAVFLVCFVAGSIPNLVHTPIIYGGISLFYAVTVFAVVVGYYKYIFLSRPNTVERLIGQNLLSYLAVLSVYAIVALPITPNAVFGSSWFRMTYVSLVFVGFFAILNVTTIWNKIRYGGGF